MIKNDEEFLVIQLQNLIKKLEGHKNLITFAVSNLFFDINFLCEIGGLLAADPRYKDIVSSSFNIRDEVKRLFDLQESVVYIHNSGNGFLQDVMEIYEKKS